jgi:arabinofuranan 3-O-arabinosyltransferase
VTATTVAHPAPSTAAPRPTPRGLRAVGYAALVVLAYLPVLLTARGRVIADTKSYLYLDPGRLLERAPSMWDPNIGLGTVTHQNIGYVFPMGPYYWVTEQLGLPDWVAQRLWFGSILLFAGLGMLFLLRTLHVRGPGVPAAAVVFMLSPYVLDFAARLSVILLPWAGMPWMLAIVIRALRDDGRAWKWPAVFAIVVQVIGSVNATALVFAGIVPTLWIFYAVFVTREVDVRAAGRTVLKIAVLTVLASLWWIAGLWAQSGYGIEILRFTETLETVAHASLPSEVLRGLGYWFFYGGDKVNAWIDPSVAYTQDLWLIAVGYALPLLAFASAAVVRWRHRAFFVVVMVVGFVVAVGAHPYDDPTPVGGLFKTFAASSSFGLALRSTARAVPLLVLGSAVLIGVGVNALAAWARGRRVPVVGVVAAALVMILAFANLPSLWQRELFGGNLDRAEDVPAYWSAAAAALDADGDGTRVLEIPGADFASYRWGNTVDPITPGIMDRPYVARELVPWGSPATADLLNALDGRIQEDVLDPAALAPIARLMNVGDIVYRADLQTDRFDLPRAVPLWRVLTDPEPPPGLEAPVRYGEGLGPALRYSQVDEVALALPTDAETPPPVSVFALDETTPIVRAASADTPLLVSGSGEGLVDLAPLGALDHGRIVLYSGTFAGDAERLRHEAGRPDAVLVVTDSNRKRGRRWGAIRDTHGATERTGESPLADDEGDQRLELFPDAGPSAQTVVVAPDARVTTSRIGNKITYWPEDRGARALDGDVDTAWEVGDHGPVRGERIRIDTPASVTTDRVNLVQRRGPGTRFITEVTLTFDGAHATTATLDDASRTDDGQTVEFPSRTFRRLEITIDDTNVGDTFDHPASNDVGLAEIRYRDDAPDAADVRATEVVRMPTDLVDTAPRQAAARPLVYSMARSRNVVIPPRFSQDEEALVREFRVPDEREFAIGGTVRLATAAPDDVLDRVLGIAGADAGGVTVRASQHLPGDVTSRGSSALDGDPTTRWSTAFGEPVGQWIEVQAAQPVTLDRLDLEVVNDGRHSVPTQVRVEAGGQSRVVELPEVDDQAEPNATTTVPVTFTPLSGDRVRVTVTDVRPVTTVEYHENQPIVMPVALAEVGVPGLRRAALPTVLPAACRSDLVTLDGDPVPVRLAGSSADALAGRPVDLEPCADPVTLADGDHLLQTPRGVDTGIDVDGVVLGSDRDGGAMALGPGGALGAATAVSDDVAEPPATDVTDDGRTKKTVAIDDARPGRAFWLVLGQSNNEGWAASGPAAVANPSTLVDGFANGWLVTPERAAFTMDLRWTPQRVVWIALAVSAATMLVCVVLASRRRRRATDQEAQDAAFDGTVALARPTAAPVPGTSAGRAALGGLLAGVAGLALSRWWVGLVLAALVVVVLLRPALRAVLTVGACVAVAAVGLYVVVQQYRYRYPYEFFWVEHFDAVTDVAWLAVLLLAADACIELVRARAPRHDQELATRSTA